MLLYLIKFFVVLVDIQTLITIIAANLIKDPKHIYFWAILATLIGEGIALYLGHADPIVFILRLLGQLLLGVYIVRSRRKRGAFKVSNVDASSTDTPRANVEQSNETK